MNIEKMAAFIYDEIDNINPQYKVSHFEFVSNSDNSEYLEEYLKSNNIDFLPLDEVKQLDKEEYEFLFDNLFWHDYQKIFNNIHSEYIKNNIIYNKDILQPKFLTKKQTPDYTYFRYLYRIIGDNSNFEFKVSHYNGSQDFQLDINLKHSDILSKEYENMNRKESTLYHNYMNNLNLEPTLVPVNKKNIETFITYFLHDINKYNLTNNSLLYHIRKSNKNGLLSDFLSQKYNKEKIEQSFHPSNISNHQKSHNRSFFDYETCYKSCLEEDLINYCHDINIEKTINGMVININYIDQIDLQYYLDISEDRVFIHHNRERIAEWYNIQEKLDIKDEIIHIIENDFRKELKNKPDIEIEVKNYLKEKISPLLIKDDIEIELPDFKDLKMKQILISVLPVVFKKGF